MMELKAREIAKKARGRIISGDENIVISHVVIDSREATEGSMFVAIKGESTDGHRFLSGAMNNGAKAFLISDEEAALEYGRDIFEKNDLAVILVEDSLYGLQEFSAGYYLDLNMDSIAVTGSVGKTTTRDMLYAAISYKFNTGTNKKNYNSETGLPLTLLSFTKDMEKGVLEMGMDAEGQIARLVELTEPIAAVITNVGISHIERLGSRENIMKAKMEVTKYFDQGNTLIVNWDDDMLSTLDERRLPYELIKVGTSSSCQYRIENIKDLGDKGISFSLKKDDIEKKIELPIPGAHNAINYALAVSGAEVMGVSMDDAIKGIERMEMTGSRLKILQVGEIKIIDDAYNAAPASMKSAISTLENTEAKRKIAILGGINELGKISEEEHRGIGKFIRDRQIDLVITVGEMARWIGEEAEKGKKGKKVISFQSKENIYPEIESIFKPGDSILVKASRSYELDKLAEEIRKRFTDK